MTPLGLGAEHCREALGCYRASLSALAALISLPQPPGAGGDALVACDDLINTLAVDTLARRGPNGNRRMSQVEAELFAPAITAAHHDLEVLARERPSQRWLPALQALDGRLAAAEHDIERWQRQVGVD